jgi:hypothetical protein
MGLPKFGFTATNRQIGARFVAGVALATGSDLAGGDHDQKSKTCHDLSASQRKGTF